MNGILSPFERGALPIKPRDFLGRLMSGGVSRSEAKAALRQLQSDEIYVNDQYQVNLSRHVKHGFPPPIEVVHLSVKRRDKAAFDDWRDLQTIKNALVGPEFEAIELFPAESRLVDTANQRHLWVLAKAGDGGRLVPVRTPVGWTGPREVSSEGRFGAVQRALA